ncbi:MAG: T9SS type A sorting domain-containing protein, partial [Salibacteraceae bacterium]
ATASLQINRNAIVDDLQQDLYSQLPLSVLKVKMESYGYSDETAISFGDTASSNGLGSWYGATKVITEVPYYPSLYSIQAMPYDTFNMAINMMEELEADRVVELKMMAGFLGNYTFNFSGMESFDADVCILLEDTTTGIFTNLRVDTSYTVLLDSTGVPDGRFRIHFTHPMTVEKVDPTCPGGNDGMVIATARPGVQAQFTWTDQSGNLLQSSNGLVNSDTLKNLPEGNYYISMLDTASAHCADVSQLADLYAPQPLQAQLSVSDASYCKATDGGISVSQVYGGTAPYQYYWSNGDTTQSLNNIGGGTYMLLLSDSNGCEQTYVETVASPSVISAHFDMSTDTLDLGQGNSVNFTNQSVNAQSYVWDFDDNSGLDTQVNPTHQFNQSGAYVVNLQANSAGCDDDYNQVLTVVNTVGVEEVDQGITFEAWPNPSNGKIYITVNEPLPGTLRIKLIDLTGKTIVRQEVQHSPNSPIELNLEAISNGVYFIQVETADQWFNRKVTLSKIGDN